MGNITLSLSDESEEELRELAKEEKRSVTKQVEYILGWYMKQRE